MGFSASSLWNLIVISLCDVVTNLSARTTQVEAFLLSVFSLYTIASLGVKLEQWVLRR